MSGLLNQYYYGKAGQGDYTVEQMPTNRKQLFFTTLKVRFSSMMGLNFLHFLFMLPAIIWIYIALSAAAGYLEPETAMTGVEKDTPYYQAYESYIAYSNENDAIVAAPDALALCRDKLKGIEHNLELLRNGETVTVDEAAVVEGGEAVTRVLTIEEVEAQKAAVEADIAAYEELVARGQDEEYMNTLRTNVGETYSTFSVYSTQAMNGNILISLIILIPLIVLATISRPGQAYVLRNWARDEHSFMWQDYKAAIASNIGQTLVVGLMNGLSFLLVFIAYVTYGSMAATNKFFIVPQAIMVVLLIVWWMMNEIIFFMMVTYKMKVRELIKNSLIMTLAHLPKSFLILLGTVGIPAAILLLIPNIALSILILLLLYAIIGFSLTSFVQASYANALFDRYLNPRIEGARVDIGLRKEEDDDDEDLPAEQQREERYWERKTK